jgi:hypothetical protein
MTTRSLPIKYIPAEVKPSEWTELYERGFRYYRYDGFYNHDKVSGFEFVRGLPIDTLYTAGLANEDDEDQDLVTVLQSIYIFPAYLSGETLHSTLMFVLNLMKKQSAYTYIHAETFQGMNKTTTYELLKNFGFAKVMLREVDGRKVWTGWVISKNY